MMMTDQQPVATSNQASSSSGQIITTVPIPPALPNPIAPPQLVPVAVPTQDDASGFTDLQSECQVLINHDIKSELQNAIKARNNWEKLGKGLEVVAHLFQGATTILAFISGAIKSPALGIVAGCTGVASQVGLFYSKNCERNYKIVTAEIKQMCTNIGVKDNLIDATQDIDNADNANRNLLHRNTILTSYGSMDPSIHPTQPKLILHPELEAQSDIPHTSSPTPTPTPTPANRIF